MPQGAFSSPRFRPGTRLVQPSPATPGLILELLDLPNCRRSLDTNSDFLNNGDQVLGENDTGHPVLCPSSPHHQNEEGLHDAQQAGDEGTSCHSCHPAEDGPLPATTVLGHGDKETAATTTVSRGRRLTKDRTPSPPPPDEGGFGKRHSFNVDDSSKKVLSLWQGLPRRSHTLPARRRRENCSSSRGHQNSTVMVESASQVEGPSSESAVSSSPNLINHPVNPGAPPQRLRRTSSVSPRQLNAFKPSWEYRCQKEASSKEGLGSSAWGSSDRNEDLAPHVSQTTGGSDEVVLSAQASPWGVDMGGVLQAETYAPSFGFFAEAMTPNPKKARSSLKKASTPRRAMRKSVTFNERVLVVECW